MSEEIPLDGGWSTDGVVRVGDTVRRPSTFSSQTMRDLLVFLERRGFDAVPRWLGVDEQGRDMLSWTDGDTYSDTRQIAFSDEQLARSARLLRLCHEAVSDPEIAGDAEVMCHGDYGPWNLIWRNGLPFHILDFDTAERGSRNDDLGYALWKHLNLGLVGLPAVEQARRARLFVTAYGVQTDPVELIADAQDKAAIRFRVRGWDDALPELAAERAWLAANRAAF